MQLHNSNMRLLAKWIIIALAILALPYIVPGIGVESFIIAIIVAFFWGFLNLVIKPLILIIALPITILTLGLFTFVINALLFWGIASFVEGFYVDGFVPAFLGALIVSAVGMLANFILKDNDD